MAQLRIVPSILAQLFGLVALGVTKIDQEGVIFISVVDKGESLGPDDIVTGTIQRKGDTVEVGWKKV